MINRGLYSSASSEWATPPDLFARYDLIYRFDLDVCASADNARCSEFFSAAEDGLSQSWAGRRCWMNPPYGREIGPWMAKAVQEWRGGATLIVCLVPARTDTAWWHDYAALGRVTFLRGRLKFGGSKNSAPFPSAIVEYVHDA